MSKNISPAGVSSVVSEHIHGHVQSGDNSRIIDTETYIENQVVNRYEQIIQHADQEQPVWSGTPPYRGLESFTIDHGEHFFGRNRLIERLLDRVQESSFVCVAGPSGSGKSSLVQAGLLYSLSIGRVESISPANIHSFSLTHTPIDKPISSIDALMREAAPEQFSIENRIVIFVDQFEEIFTHEHEEEERTHFINRLVAAAQDSYRRFVVIIAMRGEFIDNCIRHPELADLLDNRIQVVREMTPAELTEAIMQPAITNGVQIDTDLIVKIAQEMYGEPGALPLMQFALKDLFDSLKPKPKPNKPARLMLQDYADRGGVHEALKRHANRTFCQLDTEQQKAADKIFGRLISIDEQDKVSRKSVEPSQLRLLDPNPERVDEVIEMLAAPKVRLISTGYTQQDNSNEINDAPTDEEYEPRITLTHEKLIDAWPHLGEIIEKERDSIILQGQTERAALIWDTNQREASYLFKDLQLDRVSDAISEKQISFVDTPSEFVAASLKQARRLQLRSRGLLGTLALLLIPGLFVGANFWMFQMKSRSAWQPIEGFPSQKINALSISPEATQDSEPVICVGTNHIGIGCTYDYETWNLYQEGLPTGGSSWSSSRDYFWGALTGATWSGSNKAVFALDIDQADRQHVVAFLRQDGLYESQDGGLSWNPLYTKKLGQGFPTKRIAKLHVDGNYLFLASGIYGVSDEEKGHLFISTDYGESFITNLKMADVEGEDVGQVKDFVALKDSATGSYKIYFVSSKGLYQAIEDRGWQVDLISKSKLGREYLWIFYDQEEQRFYLVEYDCVNANAGCEDSDTTRNLSQLYEWSVAQDKPEPFGSPHTGAILDLAINPTKSTTERVWALFQNDGIFSIDGNGRWIPQAKRPGWLWSQYSYIWFAPDQVEGKIYVPYAGHTDGILELNSIANEENVENQEE